MTASRKSTLSCDHGLRRQTIVEALLTDIVRGKLRGGQRLVTESLAERFGVSHTPIREALITLAGVGIIDLSPNRGALVRRVTQRDVREILQVRRVLECEAVRSACGRIELSVLASLAADLERLTRRSHDNPAAFVREARRTDSALHDLVAMSCGNAFLAHELERLRTLFRAFRDVSYAQHAARHDVRRLSEEAREHLEIVVALQAGDAREAARCMSRHIRAGGRYWGRGLPQSDVHNLDASSPSARPRSAVRRAPLRRGNATRAD